MNGMAYVHGELVEVLGLMSMSWMARIFEPEYITNEVYWIARGNRLGWCFGEYVTWV